MLQLERMTEKDILSATEIGLHGKQYLKQQGVPQWQESPYPDRQTFEEMVEDKTGHVIRDDGKVIAVCSIHTQPDPSYAKPDSGTWLSDGPYMTIHTVAIHKDWRGKGISSFMFSEIARMAKTMGFKSLRADTHRENVPMNSALSHAGFVKCCDLTLISGPSSNQKRVGYELVL